MPLLLAITIHLALLFSCTFTMAQDFSKVKIQVSKISNSLSMLRGAGGNIGVLHGEDGLFLIDDQYAPLTERIKAALKKVSDKPVRFVINTHWHGDHTGGNENFGKAGATIVAHENVRERMSTDQVIQAFGRQVKASPKGALPVITFTRDIRFHLNGQKVDIFHAAQAHTDGDAIIHFHPANVFHLGDIYFNGIYPFIDLGSGGDIDGVIEAVQKVLEMANDQSKIIPGHGPLATRKDLAGYLKMLQGVRKNIAELKMQGKSLKEVQRLSPTSEFDPLWGKGFMKPLKFIEIVYSSI